MNIVLLAVIALVLLGGLIAIGVGNRGWNWGTVTGAILLLLATTGYLYLAAWLATHERSWRNRVAKNEKELARIVAGSGAGDSLAALKTQRDRWKRVQTFVDTWRGRSWKGSEFFPPQGGKPGRVTLEMPSEQSGAPPVHVGAEVAVFDNTKFEDGGRFLGIFRVTEAAANKGDTGWPMTVVAAEAPLPPSKADASLWSRDYDDVTVYETLPIDRWRAFHSLIDHAKAGGDGADGDSDAGMPAGQKTPVEGMLGDLEDVMQKVKEHDDLVPEDQWGERAAQLARGDIPQGSLWAIVEFEENVKFTKKGGLVLDEPGNASAEAPAEDEDEGPVGAPGEMAAPGEMINPDEGDDGLPSRFTTRQFAKGSLAEFDYKTAVELQDEKHWCRIKRVMYRRPLADPFTALRGSSHSQGTYILKNKILEEIGALEQNTKRVETARGHVDAQAEAVADESRQIRDDLGSWDRDVAAVDNTATAFDKRLKAATLELTALEADVVDLGRELRGVIATLTQTIDASAPPPVRQR